MLRRALERDGAFLRALFLERKRAEFAPLQWPEAVLQAFIESQAALRAQAHRGLESWVAVEGDTPVGQLLVASAPGELRIVELVVALAARGRGVASSMLREFLARADAERCVVKLHVEHGNPAERLYRKHGFVDDGPPEPLGQRLVRAALT